MKVVGLMSGTSVDGIDAVLARFCGGSRRPRWRILGSVSLPYPASVRERLLAAGQGKPMPAAEFLDLAEAVTEAQAAAVAACDPAGQADLVGCHGQTIWHRPPTRGRRGASWQLLQGPLLAELVGRRVVYDFRAADLALGGEGAPLVPAADAALVGPTGGWRALLNLGGIANLTLLPPAGGPDRCRPIAGWDCGPANTLLDLAVQRFSAGRLHFDAEGAWAARGRVEEEQIAAWLQEPYFSAPPPKSTGREQFGAADLHQRIEDLRCRRPEADDADVLATLTAFSAAVVAQDLQRNPRPVELLVAGGGSRNRFLMGELRRRCRGIRVRPLAELGIADQQREALAFALLAWWQQRGHPGSVPSVTGARQAAVLGVCACPGGRRPTRSAGPQ
jgi:anhydro-N-acetylmuramic acid kinase